MTSGSTITYPSLSLAPQPAASSGTETVTLNSTAPTGLTVKLASTSVNLSTERKATVGMTITSTQGLAPGTYTITVGAAYGTSSKTSQITLKVVQYLVLETGNSFSSRDLTVKTGSTVYWLNMDAPSGPDPETHNVVFNSPSTTRSPDMTLYDSFQFTFSAAGTYSYFCAFHPGMMGTVTVTA